MSLQDLIKMTASLSRISNANSNIKEFFNECVEKSKGNSNEADEETLMYCIKKDADFISKFIELVEQETQKENRVLMTFKTLDEMNAFIKAGNECGKSWFEDDVVKCYCYKFAAVKKTKKSVMTRAWIIAKEAAAKFGGSSKSYFAQSLKMAWSE